MGIARWIIVLGLVLMACEASYPPIMKAEGGEAAGRACVFTDNLKWRQFGTITNNLTLTGSPTSNSFPNIVQIEVNMPRLLAELLLIAAGTGIVGALTARRRADA